MQLTLTATNQSFQIETLIAGSIHYHAGYADVTTSAVANPESVQGIVTTSGTTSIVPAPAASTTRKIQYINIFNNDGQNTVTLKKTVAGADTLLFKIPLANGESIRIVNDQLEVFDAFGSVKTQSPDVSVVGKSLPIYKVGTAPEAAGKFYCYSKDSGFPGAWSVGAGGLNGRNTDGTAVGDAGCLNAGNPASGFWYLRDANISSTTTGQIGLIDILWVNTSLVVTTITAQAITQPTLPARDLDASTNGNGVFVGVLVTTATTNAGAIANMTLSYTNSAGTAGRTATIASFPATAVVGTLVVFQLQAGDMGVRSVQSITLGTTLTAGAISLISYTVLSNNSILLANTGSFSPIVMKDVKLYNGHCILPIILSTGTTAGTINGTLSLINK